MVKHVLISLIAGAIGALLVVQFTQLPAQTTKKTPLSQSYKL